MEVFILIHVQMKGDTYMYNYDENYNQLLREYSSGKRKMILGIVFEGVAAFCFILFLSLIDSWYYEDIAAMFFVFALGFAGAGTPLLIIGIKRKGVANAKIMAYRRGAGAPNASNMYNNGYYQQQGNPYNQQQGNSYYQQQGNPYYQQQGNPYYQQQGAPYNQQQGNPYYQQQGTPYNQPQGNPYAYNQQGNTEQYGNPYQNENNNQ